MGAPPVRLLPPVTRLMELVHETVEINRTAAVLWADWMSTLTLVRPPSGRTTPPSALFAGSSIGQDSYTAAMVDEVIWRLVDADIRNG